MNTTSTFWDACISSLPAEKRAAAERALRDIESGGPDGMFPKVFLLMEAHTAYVNTIPARITDAGDQAVARMREIVEAHRDNAAVSKEDMAQILTAIKKADGIEPLKATRMKMEEMTIEVRRLNRQITRLRNLRVGSVIFVICLTALLFYTVYWWSENRILIRTISEINEGGVQIEAQSKENRIEIKLWGHDATGTVKKDGPGGESVEVVAEFSER